MSADNYIYVRKREDGRFGVSMRFASSYYVDEDAGDSVPVDWFCPIPNDRYGIFDTSEEAVMSAHKAESKEAIVEYGVRVGPEVFA